MKKEFVISDLHLGHTGILKYRTQFKTIEEHDSFIINNWNSVVTPQDKVYVLGDVAWNKKALEKVALLNGQKILIAGNHDILGAKQYLKYFKDIRGLWRKGDYWLSHAPIHSNESRGLKNIHGHLHSDIVWTAMNPTTLEDFPDRNYINVCCEHINYTPILIKDLL